MANTLFCYGKFAAIFIATMNTKSDVEQLLPILIHGEVRYAKMTLHTPAS